ncbi:IclR family transcriptional regulator domain-containing protein [Shigella flexneri]
MPILASICRYCSAMGRSTWRFVTRTYVKSYWESHQHEIAAVNPQYHYRAARDVDELAHIRESGAAMDRRKRTRRLLYCCSVFDIHGRVPYAVSISLSTSRLKQVGEKKSPETTA